MELRDYFTSAKAHRLLIVLMTVAGGAVALGVSLLITPQYASTAELFVSTSAAADDTQALEGGQFSLQRVKSYAHLVEGQAIARRVIETEHLDESPRELVKQINGSAVTDTVILEITVTDASPDRAQRLANAVSREFVAFVDELETPPEEDRATIKATVVDAATKPTTWASPRLDLNISLGVVLGLVLGVSWAVLRETSDTSVTSVQDLVDLAGAPLIGSVPFDPNAAKEPVLSGFALHTPRAEASRVLRTNLRFIDPEREHKVFVVTSSLPEEGKTTTAINLAISLAEGGESVALVECDLRRPRVADYLNLEGNVGLTTILLGDVSLEDSFQSTTTRGLSVITSGRTPPNPAELLQTKAMALLLDQLRDQFDVVIVDAPPLIPVTDAALLSAAADGAIVVVRHGKTKGDEVTAAVHRLSRVGTAPAGVIFNMIPKGTHEAYGYGYSPAPRHSH